MLALLRRRRDFRLLGFALLTSILGDWLLLVAVPLFVFQHTRSSLATGATTVSIFVPRLVLGMVSGLVLDMTDRKRTIILTHLAAAVVLVPLFAVSHLPGLLWLVYPVLFLLATASQTLITGRSTLVPALVERQELADANALVSTIEAVGRVAGPPIGGLLMAFSGLDVVVALDMLSFLGAVLFLLPIRMPAVEGGAARVRPAAISAAIVLGQMRDGWDAIRRIPGLVRVLVASAAVMLSLGAFNALSVPFASGVLRLDSRGVGILVGAYSVANLALAPFAPRVMRLLPIHVLFVAGVMLKGAVLVAMVTFRVPVLELPIFALFGAPDVVMLVAVRTAIQGGADRAVLGRVVSTVWTVMNASQVVGSGGASIVSQATGPVLALGATGAGMLGIGALLGVTDRRLRAVVAPGAETGARPL